MQRTAFCIHHYKAVMLAEGDCGELRNGRFAPVPAVRYLTGRSNDWMKKTCAKRRCWWTAAHRRQVEMRQACLPVGQVAPVAPATYRGFMKR
jgi:hypothetical protein